LPLYDILKVQYIVIYCVFNWYIQARDSEWQWHQLGDMQICTSLQTDNHASTPPLSFLQTGCPSCRPTNRVKALKATIHHFQRHWLMFSRRQLK